jgi:biopolymer transport protein ExbD
MKKCSHSAHETLTELNITPLLDLAFVLLVIFIITTIPPVENKDLKLPVASKSPKEQPPKANYLSLQADGKLFLNREEIKMDGLLSRLISLRTDDPDLHIIVRGDGKTHYKGIRSVLDICQQANVPKLELATEVDK